MQGRTKQKNYPLNYPRLDIPITGDITSRPVPGVIGCPPGVPGKYEAELGVMGCPGVDGR